MKYRCPCCGYYTFENEPATTLHDACFDICPVCYWEDDPVQLEDPTFAGGADTGA